MKKIILTGYALTFSILMYAQSSTAPVQQAEPTKGRDATTVTPASPTPSNPRPAPTPAPVPSEKPHKEPHSTPTSQPTGTTPPQHPAPIMDGPKPTNSGDYDNGNHKNKGKHKGQIKHDHEKKDKEKEKNKSNHPADHKD